MTSALEDLLTRIGTNTLTTAQQLALTNALSEIVPDFPSPDETSVSQGDEPLARIWIGALYTIAGEGVSPVPVVTVGTSIVPDIASLEALPNASLPVGAPAEVQQPGSAWSLSPSTTLPVDGITVVAGADGRRWLRGASLVVQTAKAQLDWHVNAVSGNDSNTGVDASHALKSFTEWLRRVAGVGATAVDLPLNITINIDTDLPASDAIDLTVYGPGILSIVGTLEPVAGGAGIPLTTFTALNTGTGAMPHVNSVGHAWTPGQLVHDTTRNLSWWVLTDLGGGTSEISTPLQLPLTAFPSRGTPVNGDTLSVFTCPDVFVNWLSAASQYNGVILTNVNIRNDFSSVGQFANIDPYVLLAESTIANFLIVAPDRFLNLIMASCWACSASSVIDGAPWILGGAVGNNAIGGTLRDAAALDYDASLKSNDYAFHGRIILGSAHFDAGCWPTGEHNGPLMASFVAGFFDGPARVWGPFTMNVEEGNVCQVHGVTAVASLLATGGLQLDGAATGWAWNAGGNAFAASVALTPASVDANIFIQNPKSNAAFQRV